MAKWIKCKRCGHEFSSVLSRCPECSKWHPTAKVLISSIIGVALCAVVVSGIVSGFSNKGKANLKDSMTNESEQTSADNTQIKNNPSVNTSSAKDSQSDKASSTESNAEEVSTPSVSQATIQNNETDNAYPIGTIVNGDFVYTTVPKFYLDYLYEKFEISKSLTFESFAYELSDEDKEYGYTEIIKNSDDSATKVLPFSKITPVTAERLANSFTYIKETEKSEFVKKINHNDKLDEFEIILNADKLNDEQKTVVMLFGIYFLEYQYSVRNGSNKCELSLVYTDNTKESISFPKAIK